MWLELIYIYKDYSGYGMENVGGGGGTVWQYRALSGSYCRVQGKDGGDLTEMLAVEVKGGGQTGDMFLRNGAF